MPASILLLLIFCGRSSSLLSLKWADDGAAGRIGIAGEEGMVPRKRFPFMAYIIGDDAVGCSATIVSRTAMLTVASCIVGRKAMKAWAGSNQLLYREDLQPPTQRRDVGNVATFSRDDMERHDVGVAWVLRAWDFGPYVRPVTFWIQMPLLTFEFLTDFMVLGWGYDSVNGTDRVLRMSTATVGSSVMCPFTWLQQQRHLMCSNDGDMLTICDGDQGGALVAEFPMVGLVQMGIVKSLVPGPLPLPTPPSGTANDPACFVPTVASMYTYIGFYRKWLLEVIKDLPTVMELAKVSIPTMGKPIDQDSPHEKERSRGGAMALTSRRLALALAPPCLLLLPAFSGGRGLSTFSLLLDCCE